MDSTSFEQLTEIWKNLKSIESNYSNKSNYATRSTNEASNKQNDEEILKMEQNIEEINMLTYVENNNILIKHMLK